MIEKKEFFVCFVKIKWSLNNPWSALFVTERRKVFSAVFKSTATTYGYDC